LPDQFLDVRPFGVGFEPPEPRLTRARDHSPIPFSQDGLVSSVDAGGRRRAIHGEMLLHFKPRSRAASGAACREFRSSREH
jgi:hypothetical protein